MPEGKAPAQFDRRIIALLLTAQVVLGGLLGLAVPVVLLYAAFDLAAPVFGYDLLDLARDVADADRPGGVIGWFGAAQPR